MSIARIRIILGFAAMTITLGVYAAGPDSLGSWRHDGTCGTDLRELEPAEVPNCEIALCGDISPIHSKVCACLRSSDTGETEISVSDGHSSRTVITAVSPFEDRSFRIIAADFLGTGESEVLVAVLNTASNGMGVEYWSLWVVGPNVLSGPLKVNDFGVMSFLTSTPEGKCEIFAASWRPGWEPKRGQGLYIVGQWYEMLGDDLLTDWDRPALYRRYSFELERQRNEALSRPQRQLSPWHKSLMTHQIIGPYPVQ